MKILAGIIFTVYIYECCCDLFGSVTIEEDEGDVLVILKDPYKKTRPLKIKINLQKAARRKYRWINGKRVENMRIIEDCFSHSDANTHCLQTTNGVRLLLQKENENCLFINYTSKINDTLEADINIANLYLYGGAEHTHLKWPIDKLNYKHNSYVTKTEFYQAVLESYWLTSNGYYIYVDEAVPLFISLNPEKRSFRLMARNAAPYMKRNSDTILNLTVCKLKNVKLAQEHAIQHVLGTPASVPDLRRVINPIWSTWVRYKGNIDERKVLTYAVEIRRNGYEGQIEIDDNWERCYGSFTPDENKFSDLKRLVQKIKTLGFEAVNIWVHPFVNADCEPTYSDGIKNNFFVKNVYNNSHTVWWRGENASYVDFTNPEAVEWYRDRLLTVRENYDIDSFKFDGGESNFSPKPSKFYVMNDDHPETIVKEYVKLIASLGTNVHTRVARGTQRYPVYVTMMDRESRWKQPLGLSTLIPQLLQLNVLGYSFVMPDMIGGNFYEAEANGELFIRYLQANVFMPTMQFSMPPWVFGSQYVALTQKFMELRSQYTDKIINLMRKHIVTGVPVNPPIWWISPNDEEAFVCDSEFLLGEDLLVAPVLEEGMESRDIYLPGGFWRDENNVYTAPIQGPIWLQKYPANLSVLPYFTRVLGEGVNLAKLNGGNSSNEIFTFIIVVSLMLCVSYSVLYLCKNHLRARRRIYSLYNRIF